jgi:peptide/nickel transport system permease protein
MTAYLVRRLVQSVVLIFVVASVVAVFIQLLPGDPAYIIVGETNATPERLAAVRRELGLDRPLYVQYLDWMRNVLRGDLGTSLTSKRPIGPDLAKRIPRTFELIAASMLLALAIGIPGGVLAAQYRNRGPDYLASFFSMLWISTPVFVTGTLLVLLFDVKLRLFPATGYVAFGEDPIEHLRRLVLPAATLALLDSAVILRMTRSSLLEVLGEDYVRTARAKGLSERTVLFTHSLRNALIPVITIVGLQVGTLLGGTVLVEFIFNWPGISSYLIAAIHQRDYPTIQAVILVIASLLVFINLLTDLVYAVIDPRVKYG